MTPYETRNKFHKRKINRVSDLTGPLAAAKFIAVIEDSISCMGDNYGPPDPPPSMETTHFTRIVALMSEEEVVEWVNMHTQDSVRPAPYKILKIEPVTINTSVSVSLG